MAVREQQKQIVVFLGAGFSKGAGIPTMDRFAERVRDSLSDQQKAILDQAQVYCNEITACFGQSARNIEQLLSTLQVLDHLSPGLLFNVQGNGYAACYVTELLVKAMYSAVRPDISSMDCDFARNLLGLASKVRLTVVTTNYDLIPEVAGLSWSTPLKATPTPGVMSARASQIKGATGSSYASPSSRDPTYRLMKLHGSVNWFADHRGNVEVMDQLHAVPHGTRGSQALIVRTDEHANQSMPLLVAPTINKSLDNPVIREQWTESYRALRKCHEVWFIGYSFPDSDIMTKMLMAASLSKNPVLRRIVCINPDIDVCKRKATAFINVPHLREIYSPIPMPFGIEMNLVDIEQGRWSPSLTHPHVVEARNLREWKASLGLGDE